MKHYLPPGRTAHLAYPQDATAGDILAGSARRYGDRTAIRDGELVLTYAELYDHALRVAAGLRARGVGRGGVVALHQPNSLWFTVCYYGILLAGAAVTPVNPSLPPAALRDQLEEAAATVVFTHSTTYAALRRAEAAGVRLTVLVPATAAAPGPAPDGFDGLHLHQLLAEDPAPTPSMSGDDVAHLSFTGGTTGRSKAVRVLHRNLVANALQMGGWRGAGRPCTDDQGGVYLEPVPEASTPYTMRLGESTGVALAPMFHAMGLVSQTVSTVTGAAVVVVGRFDPRSFVRAIEEHRISAIPGSPTLFHALLAIPGVEEADLTSVRVVNSGAAPIDTHTLGQLHDLFPNACIVEGYGLTEATMALTTHPLLRDNPTPRGSVGAPLFDTEIVIRELGCGPEVPVGEAGEVWARGPQITDGYQGHPELTAEQYQDGWLRTGDIGRFDEDGWLYLVGRAKDMLIYKGYNVYPTPLEELLHQHPAVADASVIGAQDPAAGEIPVAYVVLRDGYEPGGELARELMEFVAGQVAPYAKVREVRFIAQLPVSAAGKILKTELRKRYRSTGIGD
ncbi:class I adenylate-forming enzyme family protein [Streptomyces sp. BE230]|uniref:class I adenylate-forming enzyme family protein n=1 Tax=Streptomyces sp. BE230 TaxID=3002526 RepID=UPI002ED5990E|nr:class I adenylate-forming enzyme family protein [Streptomyces sp. BE230]